MIVGKAVKMAKMMNIPVLGIVENYSYLACPDCGKHISVFGESHIDEVSRTLRAAGSGKTAESTRSWLRRLTQARSRMQSCRTSFPVRLRPWRVCYEHWRSI